MRLLFFSSGIMLLFAGNSILCRLALVQTGMDAQSFTLLRVLSGAFVLLLITMRHKRVLPLGGSCKAALALFIYMAAFSCAYVSLAAATGTLILVVAILLTTIVIARILGEKIYIQQFVGMTIAFAGLIALLGPSLARPPVFESFLMAAAGASWAVYSLLGKNSTEPTHDTAGNFIRALPFCLLLLPFHHQIPTQGIIYAVGSGALASGLGYVLWYRLVAVIPALNAALLQLSTPVLTALGGWFLLGEAITLRFVICGFIILGSTGYVQLVSLSKQSYLQRSDIKNTPQNKHKQT